MLEKKMESTKIVWISIIITFSLALIINLIPSTGFFGAYFVDVYIIFPLFSIQLFTLFFYKKKAIVAITINILIVLAMLYITYKFFINR